MLRPCNFKVHGSYDYPFPVPVFWNITLSMHIYDILSEHIIKSMNMSKKLVSSLALVKLVKARSQIKN